MFFKILNGIFFTIIVLVALFLLATKISIPGNFSVRIVQSGSMEPAIKTGSLIVTQPKPDYEVGDIITFGEDSRDSVPTTHRIIEENSDGSFYTQGDANETRDAGSVPESKVLGKMVFKIPYLGYVVDFAREPIGFILLIVVPAFIVMVDEIIIIFKEASRLRKKKKEEQAIDE